MSEDGKKRRRTTRRNREGRRKGGDKSEKATTDLLSGLMKEEQNSMLETTSDMWVPSEEGGFVRGVVKQSTDEGITVELEGGKQEVFSVGEIYPMNPKSLEKLADMSGLSHLNEPSVLHNLKQRYESDVIYTYSGLFLVAINPYKSLPIYSKESVERHQGKQRNEVEPHVFNLADNAYRNMLNTKQNQSMLVTGESGAGKTVNTKKIIQYLTAIAGSTNKGDVELEQQILRTNPLLEAFGNATTGRNDNSSRFGKFIEINFNASGYITGTKIDNYLLETTRVLSQLKDDRNFHIFYQIFTDPELVKKFHLKTPSDYEYLKNSTLKVDTIDDVKEFKDTRRSMEVIGFSKKEITFAFSVVAAILHIGNIKFTDGSNGLAQLKDKSALKTACKILGVSTTDLEKALIKPKLITGTESIDRHEKAADGMFNKDALVEEIYKQLFNWLVARINKSLTSKEAVKSFIGVLDIAGFEIFELNSFEQLCINYTNEKLQQFFNQHMFKKEQEIYLKEQIDWKYIDFGDDLQATIDLIENTGGILSLLDSQVFMKSKDDKLVGVFEKSHKGNPVFELEKFEKMKFRLTHYAGVVTYDVNKWLTKNTDPMNDDCKKVILASKKVLVRKIFKGIAAKPKARGGGGAKFKTVSKRYKEQLDALMNVLRSTEPHFIRCIIPNGIKKPGKLDDEKVLHQLRCNGVLEGIRISRKGYPGRHLYKNFVSRYRIICSVFDIEKLVTQKEMAELICNTAKLEETKHYKLGLTKVFFKAGVEAKLEKLREVEVNKVIITAQAAMRGASARKAYQRELDKINSVVMIQENWRSYYALKNWAWWGLFMKARPLISDDRIEKEMGSLKTLLQELKNKIDMEVAETKKMEGEKQEIENKLKEKNDIIGGKQASESEVKEEMERVAASVKQLQAEIDALERDKKKLQMEKDDLFNKEKGKLGDLEAKNKEIEKLKSTLEEEKQKFEDLKQQVKDLEEAKIKLTAETKELDSQVQDKKQKLEYGNTNLNEMKRQHAYFGEQIKDVKFRFGNKAKDLAKAEEKLADIVEQLKQTEENLSKAKDENEIYIQSNTTKESQVTVLETDVATLTKQIENLKRDEKSLMKQNRELNDSINSTDTARANSEKQLKNVREEVSELNAKLSKLKEEQSLLKDSTNNLSDTITAMRNKLIDLEDDKLNLTKAKGELSKNFSNLDFDHKELTERSERQTALLNKKKDDIEKDMSTQLEELNKDIAKLKKKLKNVGKSQKDLKRDHDKSQAEKDNLDGNLRKLEVELTQEQQNLISEKKKTQDLVNKNRSLTNKIKDTESKIKQEEDDKKRLDEKIIAVQQELVEKKETAEALQKDISELEADKSEISKEVSKAKVDLQSAKDSVLNLTHELTSLEGELTGVKTRMEEANIVSTSLKTKTKDINQRVLDSNILLQTTEAEKKNVEKKLEKLLASNESYSKKIQEKTDEFNKENEARLLLDGQLRDVNGDSESAGSKLIDLKNKKKTLNEKLRELREKEENATQEDRKLKSERQVLENKSKDLEEVSVEHEARIIEIEATIKELKEKVETTQKDATELIQERLNTKNDNRKIQNELAIQTELNNESSRKNKIQNENMKKRLETQENENEASVRKLADEKASLKKESKLLNAKSKGSEEDDGVDKEELSKIQSEYELQLQKIRTELEDERKLKLDAEAAKRTLEFKQAEAQDDLEQEERKRKKIDSKKKSLQLDMEELKELADEAEEAQDDLDLFKSESETKQESLKSDLQRERSARQAAQTSLVKLKREVAELQRSHKGFKSDTDGSTSQLSSKYEDELADLEKMLTKAKDDKKKASRSSKKIDRATRELNRKIQNKEREKLTYEEKYASEEKELEKQQEEFLNITKRKGELESKNKVLERDQTSLKKKVQDLEDELTRARSEAAKSSKGKRKRRR